MTDKTRSVVRSWLVLLFAFLMLGATARLMGAEPAAIPWGAMYTPNESLTRHGMTGAVKSYRGQRGAGVLVADLEFARACGVRLILTLGSVDPSDYLDEDNHIRFDVVREELVPFFNVADTLRPYIGDGTIWGIRFMDEPHDPKGYARDFEVAPDELAEVFTWIKERLGDVRVGSTAPPSYMVRVPNADFACGQYNHANPPLGYEDAVAFHRVQSELAHEHDLQYVASLNANTNPIGNEAFFRAYRQMCGLESVDFAMSWQWAQGRYDMPCFSSRLDDSNPAVRAEIAGIPDACQR